jgi:type IV pilus assembly protein PilE
MRRAAARRRGSSPGLARPIRGFSLVEMMVTISILAIFARLAIPAYSSYVLRGKVSQAFAQLSSLAIGLQQVYQDNRSYSGGTTNASGCLTSGPGAAPSTNTGDFSYSCTLGTTTFTITATGKSGTTVASYAYTLDNTGARGTSTPSGALFPSNSACWVQSTSGACY